MKTNQPKLARRSFLAGAGIVAAAAGATALRPAGIAAPVATKPAVEDTPGTAEGYRLSEHIRKYYKTTLI